MRFCHATLLHDKTAIYNCAYCNFNKLQKQTWLLHHFPCYNPPSHTECTNCKTVSKFVSFWAHRLAYAFYLQHSSPKLNYLQDYHIRVTRSHVCYLQYVQLHSVMLLCDKVAWQNQLIKLQVWHWSMKFTVLQLSSPISSVSAPLSASSVTM